MLDLNRTLDQLADLTMLKFFPADPGTRFAIANLIAQMCSTEEQVAWLVKRTVALCSDWPGPLVLRQIFCSKFKPADGINAGRTEDFPDGIPSETGSMKCLAEREYEAAERIALPPGHVVSVDSEMDRAVRQAAEILSNPRRVRKPDALRPPDPPINPNFKPITQADVDEAVRKHREEKALREARKEFDDLSMEPGEKSHLQ